MIEQLTIFLPPNEPAGPTQYGASLTNLGWCKREIARLSAAGYLAYLLNEPGTDNVAVFVDARERRGESK